jgi:hypothetical protein
VLTGNLSFPRAEQATLISDHTDSVHSQALEIVTPKTLFLRNLP